jgi:hypothetical protein
MPLAEATKATSPASRASGYDAISVTEPTWDSIADWYAELVTSDSAPQRTALDAIHLRLHERQRLAEHWHRDVGLAAQHLVNPAQMEQWLGDACLVADLPADRERPLEQLLPARSITRRT